MEWEDFVRTYRPVGTGIVHGIAGIPMFETFGEDWEAVSAAPDNCVWTVIDTATLPDEERRFDEEGDERWLVGAGRHVVNRLGYILTAIPWRNPDSFTWY